MVIITARRLPPSSQLLAITPLATSQAAAGFGGRYRRAGAGVRAGAVSGAVPGQVVAKGMPPRPDYVQ